MLYGLFVVALLATCAALIPAIYHVLRIADDRNRPGQPRWRYLTGNTTMTEIGWRHTFWAAVWLVIALVFGSATAIINGYL